MPLPKRNHRISAEQRDKLVKEYAEMKHISVKNPQSHRFHIDQVKELVDQPEAAELVIAKGLDEEGVEVVILSARDKKGEELPLLLEVSFPCPPEC